MMFRCLMIGLVIRIATDLARIFHEFGKKNRAKVDKPLYKTGGKVTTNLWRAR